MRPPTAAALASALLLPIGLLSGGCEMMIAGPRAQAADQWEKVYEVSPGATLEIRNTNGSIDVRADDQPTIRVTAHRRARAVSEQGAKDLLARTNLEEVASADAVRLVTPRSQGTQHIDVRYEVLVPASVAVTLATVNGKIALSGVTGAVALETVNGSIDARGITGLRTAEAVNGSVSLQLTGLPTQGARVETVNGGVTVTMPSTLAVDVAVRTVNGGIGVDGFASVQNEERRRRHYDGKLNGGGPDIRVETVNGGVSIKGTTDAVTAPATDGGSR